VGILRLLATLLLMSCAAPVWSSRVSLHPSEAVAASLSAAVDRLQRSTPAWHPDAEIQSDRAVREALLDAETVVGCCKGMAPSRLSVLLLVESCAAIASGPYSPFLRQHALATLGLLVSGNNLSSDGLRNVVAVCDSAISQPEVPLRSLVRLLDQVSRSLAADTPLLEELLGVVASLMKSLGAPDGASDGPQLLVEVLAVLSKVAQRVARSTDASVSVARILREVAEVASKRDGYSSVSGLVVQVLQDFVTLVGDDIALTEALQAFEACGGEAWAMQSDIAAELLRLFAEKLENRHLARLVGICRAGSVSGSSKALDVMSRRLSTEDFPDGSDGKLALLAEILGAQEQIETSVQCSRALHFLLQLDPPDPPSFAALRSFTLDGLALPSDLMMRIGDYMPPPAQETARSQIVEICARSARRRLKRAWIVLHAACLRPRQIGLAAARYFAALAKDMGCDRLQGVVGPLDFAHVGRCLQESLIAAPAGEDAEYLQGLDAAGAARVAAALMDVAAELVGPWSAEHRRVALYALCTVADNRHELCMKSKRRRLD